VGAASDGTADAELPEWEPLSPELLEDEAIRGDFVLRWAVALLALLFGCSQLTDARPLVHVKSGEWLAANGVLPTGHDPFSIAGAERRWVNLNWLFDLLAAGMHALGGPIALSLLQGALALAAFVLLVHACRLGIRTWWGSVCAALALLAAMPRLNATPELITLCGLAASLWLMVRCEDQRGAAEWWWFVPLLWIWAQMDPRAWMGAGLLALYWFGTKLSQRETVGVVAATAPAPWKPILAAIVVMALHPFLWEVWLAPWHLYSVEYPALRASYPRPVVFDLAWYPLWSPLVWNQPDFRLAAGLVLAFAAAAALWLDRSRVPWSHGLMFAGANIVGLLAWHDFPVAAFVNCMLATVHGQSWYLARFGQVYSVAWTEVLFSRGGRALTVASLFALAWLAISGRIDGPDGHRSGVGLDRQLRAELESFRRLSALTADDRGFHTTLRQGDALIAAGRKSFVDHRVRLFAGAGDENLLAVHNETRRSLRRPRPDDPTPHDPLAWRDTFARFHLSHVLPRLTLTAVGPDYETLLDLLSSRDWVLTEVLPATAVLHWVRSPEPVVGEFIARHELNVVDRAFRQPERVDLQPRERRLPPTWSQRLFSLPRRSPSGSTLLAMHWMRLVLATPSAPWPFRAGCATLAVRAGQAGVQETPDLPTAYRALAEAYAMLGRLEAMPLAETGMRWDTSLRYYQAVSAAREATRLDPHDFAAHSVLLGLYQAAQRLDAAHAETLVLIEEFPESMNSQVLAERDELLKLEQQLRSAMDQLADAAQQRLQEGVDRAQVALALMQNGAVQQAADLLREDAIYVERNPSARQLLTTALMELGAGAELDESVSRLEAVGEATSLPGWRDTVAIAAVGRADYALALRHWQRELESGDSAQLQGLIYTAPLHSSSPYWLGDVGFPAPHAAMVLEAAILNPPVRALMEFNRAACEIERADPDAATTAVRRGLERAPDGALRPLLRIYLYCLTGEAVDSEPPAEWIPISADMFANEP
jgi:tetratricopeptide (TPR) repeat protein